MKDLVEWICFLVWFLGLLRLQENGRGRKGEKKDGRKKENFTTFSCWKALVRAVQSFSASSSPFSDSKSIFNSVFTFPKYFYTVFEVPWREVQYRLHFLLRAYAHFHLFSSDFDVQETKAQFVVFCKKKKYFWIYLHLKFEASVFFLKGKVKSSNFVIVSN